MTQRPVLFRNTQWILNTILKKSFYAILGYSKLMDHNDLVSLNNKRSSVVQESSTNAASQTISSAKFFNSIFKYDTDGYPMEQLTETKSGYLKSEYFTNKSLSLHIICDAI
jgi:hypothetical protein